MNELMCPHCHHEFKVDDYECGPCPSCGEMEYSWVEYWDEKDEDSGYMGFEWNPIFNSLHNETK